MSEIKEKSAPVSEEFIKCIKMDLAVRLFAGL